jgi:hypothetical protein
MRVPIMPRVWPPGAPRLPNRRYDESSNVRAREQRRSPDASPSERVARMSETERQHVEGAKTQTLFREVNERIEHIAKAHAVNGEVLCECAAQDCAEPIRLTLDEYEAVRRIPTHFFVVPGHDVPEIERVVEENERYVVVEKFGVAGIRAVQLDPRRRPHEATNDHQ